VAEAGGRHERLDSTAVDESTRTASSSMPVGAVYLLQLMVHSKLGCCWVHRDEMGPVSCVTLL
jgi:hypothetical protein